MKIHVIDYEDTEYFEAEHLDLLIDGCKAASFNCQHDCPEDNNFSRAFSDIFLIPDLMQKAYEAGKRGEDFEIVKTTKEYSERT